MAERKEPTDQDWKMVPYTFQGCSKHLRALQLCRAIQPRIWNFLQLNKKIMDN